MALILCKDCNNPVSTKAKSCPHCGARISEWDCIFATRIKPVNSTEWDTSESNFYTKKRKLKKLKNFAIGYLIFMFLCAIVGAVSTGMSDESSEHTTDSASTNQNQVWHKLGISEENWPAAKLILEKCGITEITDVKFFDGINVTHRAFCKKKAFNLRKISCF